MDIFAFDDKRRLAEEHLYNTRKRRLGIMSRKKASAVEETRMNT